MSRGSRAFSRYRRCLRYALDGASDAEGTGLACRYCGRPVSIEAAFDCGAAMVAQLDGAQPDYPDNAATIDHIDPSGGHGLENLATACWRCNREKGAEVWTPRPAPRTSVPRELVRALRSRWYPGQV